MPENAQADVPVLGKKRLILWLKAVSLAHIGGGLALPLWIYSSLSEPYLHQLHQAFWNTGFASPEADAFMRWIIALFGPTVAAWGVLMLALVGAGERSAQVWPWNALLVSLLVWAPLDIGISLIVGFWPHVMLDLSMVLAIVLPIFRLRQQCQA